MGIGGRAVTREWLLEEETGSPDSRPASPGQLQKFYFNAKIAIVAPAAAIMQARDKKFGKSGAERLFAQSALLLMAKTFSQVEFFIFVFSKRCQRQKCVQISWVPPKKTNP